MGYTLVKTESLEKVANAIRLKGGTTADLVFPDGFVAAIEALQSTPAAPTSETLGLGFVSGTYTQSGFTAVGHNNGTNHVSKWSFAPTINASGAVFTFDWANKTEDGGPGIGYNDPITMSITIDALGKSTTHYLENKAAAGPFSVSLTGLALVAGNTYTVTVQESVAGTTNNFKMFKQAGNTVQLTT